MKKICISIITMLLVITSAIIPVYGASHTFTLTVEPTVKKARFGETVEFKIDISDIDQSTSGISAIVGFLKFDSDLIENVEIKTINNWSVTINDETDDEQYQGKFTFAKLDGVKESQTIAKLYAKIKTNANVKSGTVTLRDVYSSYVDQTLTEKNTKIMTIKIAEEGGGQEDDPIIIPDNPDSGTPSTPDTPSTPASQDIPESPTTPAKSTSKSTGTTTTNQAKALPKAGIIASGIGIAVLAAIIVAIIELIKYKKIGK